MKSQNTRLPGEIIQDEILPRLPVKSLLRFRCVSKSWCSLIGSKKFIKTQHQYSTQNPSFPHQRLIFFNVHSPPKQCSLQSLSKEPIDLSPLDDPTMALPMSSLVLGCYNGLVCMFKRGEYYMWNPSTRISKKLELPKIANPNLYVKKCGFGWDESSGEFKVFEVVHEYDDWDVLSCGCRIYSSKTKSWKTIEYNFTDSDDYFIEAGVFVGGKLHWKENNDDIVFLDFKSEVFGSIRQPFNQGHPNHRWLGQIGGLLCFLYDFDVGRSCRVWVMKESGSWERLVDLSLDHELLQSPVPASFTHKGSNGEIFVFAGYTFLVYNPRDNVFRIPRSVAGILHMSMLKVYSRQKMYEGWKYNLRFHSMPFLEHIVMDSEALGGGLKVYGEKRDLELGIHSEFGKVTDLAVLVRRKICLILSHTRVAIWMRVVWQNINESVVMAHAFGYCNKYFV